MSRWRRTANTLRFVKTWTVRLDESIIQSLTCIKTCQWRLRQCDSYPTDDKANFLPHIYVSQCFVLLATQQAWADFGIS